MHSSKIVRCPKLRKLNDIYAFSWVTYTPLKGRDIVGIVTWIFHDSRRIICNVFVRKNGDVRMLSKTNTPHPTSHGIPQ
jgi:hypothetical protein